jgi:hypothetical protein
MCTPNKKTKKFLIRVFFSIAMFQRSRKADNTMKNYYIVIGAFVGVCVLSVLYVLLNPKKSFAQMPVIDDTAILVHNGQQGVAFQRGENQFFQVSESYTYNLMNIYRTGLYLMLRPCLEILSLTLPMSLLARLVRRTQMRSFPRNLIGERSTPSAFKI